MQLDSKVDVIVRVTIQRVQNCIMVIDRERDSMRLAVRANESFNEVPIEDPLVYQDFFTALDKAMLLTFRARVG